MLDTSIQQRVDQWLQGNYDQETKNSIRHLLDREAYTEITDSFFQDLEFGTGGLRGIMGVGSNRVNTYTLGMATQGFSNHLNTLYPPGEAKVVVAHDSRNNSRLFAQLVADVFSANGITVYTFEDLRPTPELSFAIRYLNCQGGVMLTASHNPKEYNGYKAYGADGGQLVFPHDEAVMNEVRKVLSIDDVKWQGDKAKQILLDGTVDEAYLAGLSELSISKEAIARQHDMKIVFSPIHGTGITMVPPVLERFGFTNILLVEEQTKPDGNFPTVVYPNPEEAEALSMALAKAREADADLVLATDPDADRVGIAIKNTKGEFVLLNGNQTGCLLINYLLEAWENAGKLTGKEYICKTIVTSYLIDTMAESKGVACYNVLTGFKYIGELMTKLEGKETFIGGGEESYGYLIGDMVRDKDAVISAAMIAEMTAYYKDKGSSLYEAMLDMYMHYGLSREKLVSVTIKGKQGVEEIRAMMQRFRSAPPSHLGGSRVVKIMDYKSSEEKDTLTGQVTKIDLPSSNVMQFYTENGGLVTARPSGTEPKIKFYCSMRSILPDHAAYDGIVADLDAVIDTMIKDLKGE